jgi:hypothetical protein
MPAYATAIRHPPVRDLCALVTAMELKPGFQRTGVLDVEQLGGKRSKWASPDHFHRSGAGTRAARSRDAPALPARRDAEGKRPAGERCRHSLENP